MGKLNKEEYLRIYDITSKEEQFYVDAHHKWVVFFSGIITALFGAMFAGILNAKDNIHFIYLTIGAFVIILIAILAIFVTSRYYDRFILAVSVKAKIEQVLGMTTKSHDWDQYWTDEPLIPERFLKDRLKYPSSSRFIFSSKRRGINLATFILFTVYFIGGIFLFIFLILKIFQTCLF